MARGQPGRELTAELRAVSSASLSVRKAVAAHNYLPDDFPVAVVELECKALELLHLGSIAGAQIIIEHALVRLSDIRRSYFQHTEVSDETVEFDEDEGADLPHLERGDALDREFSFLLSSLSTALDAVRAQLQQEFASAITDEYLDVAKGELLRPSQGDPIENAKHLEELGKFAAGESAIASQQIDNLARAAIDSRNSVLATSAETNSSVVILGWLRRLSKHTASALRATRVSIETIRLASNQVYDFYKKYQSSLDRVEGVVVEEVGKWLDDISSRLSTAESNLRAFASGEKGREYGVCRLLHNQTLIIGEDGSPFSLDASISPKPAPDTIISFVKTVTDKKVVATSLRPERKIIFVRGKFLPLNDASKLLGDLVQQAAKKRRNHSSRQLEQHLNAMAIAPSLFWKTLGFESFDLWVASLGLVVPVGTNQSRRALYYTLDSSPIEKLDEVSFLNWALKHLEENGSKSKLGDLAEAGRKHFAVQSGLPIKVLLGKVRFSDVFLGDDRFIVKNDTVTLNYFVEKPVVG